MEGETDGEKLTIVGIADVIDTTSTILNTSSSNGTIALKQSLLYINTSFSNKTVGVPIMNIW